MSDESPTRRLAAIVCMDVAGYSRLIGLEEEGILARLRAMRRELLEPSIASHGGRLVKTTGDGALIEFASVVNAMRFAAAFQLGMKRWNATSRAENPIEYRIGVNLGDVVAEGGDIHGDGVNVASRLETLAEAGSICISASTYDQVRDKVALDYRDIGEQLLKNIARPVRVYRVDSLPPSPSGDQTNDPASQRLSIVVLPFKNLNKDTEQSYIADAITEYLTVDLTRIPSAFVISRATAFTLKDKSISTKEIGSTLGVRYLVQGSIQSGRDRIRVSVELIDTSTGITVWSERFDKDSDDVFGMQDEVTARIAIALGVQLVASESERGKRERPNNPDALDLAMRGWTLLHQAPAVERTAEARRIFSAAVQLDPSNVEALVGLANTYTRELISYTARNRSENVHLAHAALKQALFHSPDHARAHFLTGALLQLSGKHAEAIQEFERTLVLDRNFAHAHAWMGIGKAYIGRAEETEAHVVQAIRLSPRDPLISQWLYVRGGRGPLLGTI